MAAIESTLLMGGVLLAIVVAIGLVRDWERSPGPDTDRATSVAGVLSSPVAWTLGFFALALLFAVSAIGYVGGSDVIGIGAATGELILVAGFGLVMTGFLFAGLYAAARNRGMKSAQAAGSGSIVIGLLAVVVISIRLLMQS